MRSMNASNDETKKVLNPKLYLASKVIGLVSIGIFIGGIRWGGAIGAFLFGGIGLLLYRGLIHLFANLMNIDAYTENTSEVRQQAEKLDNNYGKIAKGTKNLINWVILIVGFSLIGLIVWVFIFGS